REAAALDAIRANVVALEATGTTVHAMPVERFLAGAAAPYDVVYVDPPYAQPVAETLRSLINRGWLACEATVVVERATRDEPLQWPDGLAGERSRRYGDTVLWYGRRP